MDVARLLADIVAQDAPVAAVKLKFAPAYRHLIDHGYIEEAGVVQSIHCDDCGQSHDAEVAFEEGQYGIHCPDVGFVAKERSELIAVRSNPQKLVAELANSLECKRIKTTPIHGQTWRVGVVTGPSADVAVYFQPRLRDLSDLRSLEAALAREARMQYGIVLTAFGGLSTSPFKTLHFQDCLSFDPATGSIEFFENIFGAAGAPVKRKGGRPSPYKGTLAKIIAERRASGIALIGTNAEARAILDQLKLSTPSGPTPTLSTIKRAMSKA